MKKEKLLALGLALSMTVGLLSGCASASFTINDEAATEASAEDTDETEETSENTDETETAAEEKKDEAGNDEAEEQQEKLTIEDIAKLNNCEADEINVVYDDGYVTFLGAKMSEETVSDEDEALAFLQNEASDLVGMNDDISLNYRSKFSSPNTGMTYYRFQQTVNADYADVSDAILKEMTNGIKLATDKEGHPVLISSDLYHGELSFDTDSIISAADAEAIVKDSNENVNIYSDNTQLIFWTDNSSKVGVMDSDKIIAYVVYADNESSGLEKCSPYIMYIVRAEKADKDQIVATLLADSLDLGTVVGKNKSLEVFDDMEDAGEYTYTVDFNWMNEDDYNYTLKYVGAGNMEVTVPVMYCESDGLYYLGEKEHHVFMSNYADVMDAKGNTDKLNPYVTDDPENLDSWHFKFADNASRDCTYEDDPNYVISSFASYYEVVNAYGERFDIYEAYPDDSYLLMTYKFDDESIKYPEELSQFDYNAANGGQYYDWTAFFTSPNLALCLDETVMCHEFTHGVNMHFATAKYGNEQGAVMESMADMVGYQMASTLDDSLTGWLIGGSFGPVLRNLSNPLEKGQPQYKNGIEYVNAVDDNILDIYNDYGGVHTNSGVPNYLGYLFINGQPEGSGEDTLTIEEGLNIWYETLFMATFDTDFVDLGAYLKFAASELGYSAEKQAYMERLISELGFENGQVDQKLLDSEDSRMYNITLDFEDDAIKEKYGFFDLLLDYDGGQYQAGGFEDNAEQHLKIAEDKEYYAGMIEGIDDEGNKCEGLAIFTDAGDDLTFKVKYEEIEAGQKFTIDGSEEVTTGALSITAFPVPEISDNSETGDTEVAIESGKQTIVFTQSKDAPKGEYNMYILNFK